MTKKKISQALKLIRSGKPKKLQKAQEILEIELQRAIAAGETEDEIAARHGLGRVLHYLGDQDAALQHFQTNVVKLESTPGFARLSRANMARIFRNRGAWDRAIAILEELVVNARSAGHENRATAIKLEIGHILRDTGQLEESREVYEWCLKRSQGSGDGQGVFDALTSLATLEFFVGDYLVATMTLDKASDFAEAQSDSFRLIQAMKMRALIAERQGAFSEAERLYQQCTKNLAAQHRRRGGFKEIFKGLEEILSKSNFDDAFHIYQDAQAQAFRQTIDDISFMAEIIQRRGEVQLAMRHSQEAIELLNRGLEIAESVWNLPRIAALLETLARAKLEGSPDEAETLARRSLEISENLNHPSETATAHRTIGRILRFRGEYTEAKKHLEKAVEIRRSLGYQLELCRDLQSLGEVLHETDAFREAEIIFEEGLLIGERLEAKYELALLLRSLGVLFYERGILESSIAFLEEGKGYFEEMGIVDVDIFLALAKAHLDSQNQDQALWFFELGSAMAHERNDPHSIAA
ncbi:MAG: tetratricopeptide repeat protein, partial [Candidatus Hodarchaeales archaeon]